MSSFKVFLLFFKYWFIRNIFMFHFSFSIFPFFWWGWYLLVTLFILQGISSLLQIPSSWIWFNRSFYTCVVFTHFFPLASSMNTNCCVKFQKWHFAGNYLIFSLHQREMNEVLKKIGIGTGRHNTWHEEIKRQGFYNTHKEGMWAEGGCLVTYHKNLTTHLSLVSFSHWPHKWCVIKSFSLINH